MSSTDTNSMLWLQSLIKRFSSSSEEHKLQILYLGDKLVRLEVLSMFNTPRYKTVSEELKTLLYENEPEGEEVEEMDIKKIEKLLG